MSEQKEKFAKVPIEAIEDERLSPTEFRVLVTLLSFANDDRKAWPRREAITDLCGGRAKPALAWPRREAITERCGVSPQNVSRATAALVRYGWIQKIGLGGRSSSATYLMANPFTRPDSGQVNTKTRPESDTKTRPESDTKTRPDSGRGKEQTNEQTNEQTSARAARVPAWVSKALRTTLPEWIKPATWQAFVEHRRELNAKLTTQGIQGTLDQLDRMRQAGQQPAKVIEQSILKGWTGLFALAPTRTRTRTAPSDINNLIAQGERVGIYPSTGESAHDFAARIQREAARRVH